MSVRFLVGAVRAIRNRLKNTTGDDQETAPAIFLLARGEDFATPTGDVETVHLMDQGRRALQRRVWFVNAPVIKADGLEIANWDSETLIAEIIAEWGAGEVPGPAI